MNRNRVIPALFAIAFSAIAGVFFVPPIAQDAAYHQFADTRSLFGIPNFGDVVGNFPFVLFGLLGLGFLCRCENGDSRLSMQGEKWLWGIFFFGAFLVGFGSGYYHLDPHNATLVWDRLPMTIAFMSFFALIIMERIGERAGLVLFPLLLLVGAGSVFYWDYTESAGRGDLRPYALVQFLPLVIIPFMLWLLPPRYSGLQYVGYTLGWYILAKLLEHFDDAIFELTSGAVSGHTLKHVAAAMGVYTLLLYIKKRRFIENGESEIEEKAVSQTTP